MEYTTDDYTQDIKIVNWIIRRKFQSSVRFLFDEMKQVAHIKLWELREKGNFKSVNYAITCAYYSMLNVLRENKKHLDTLPLDFDIGGATRLEITRASRITADDILRGQDIKNIIKRLSARYSMRNQRIIKMFLLDYTQKTIAEIVGISQTSVGAIIREFKRELADELGIDFKGVKK